MGKQYEIIGFDPGAPGGDISATGFYMDGEILTPDQVVELVNTQERLLTDIGRVLDAVPECPVHGPGCIPHAVDWIRKMKYCEYVKKT